MLKIKNIYIDSGKLTENIQNCIIDTEYPVFSWAVSSTNPDNEQTACRVTVSSENSVIWDSGWTEQKVHVFLMERRSYSPYRFGIVLEKKVKYKVQNSFRDCLIKTNCRANG